MEKEVEEMEKEVEQTEKEMEQPVEQDLKELEKEESTGEEKEEVETEEKPAEETDSSEEVEESAEAEPEEKEEETTAEEAPEEKKEEPVEEPKGAMIFGLRTTANREDQVMDFVESNATKKKLEVYSIIRPHGMRGYIFLEAKTRQDAEQAAFGVPYARGILPKEIAYSEIEHMLEQVKKEVNMQKNDICEIISGPFKREKAKITRIDKQKEEVVVELLEAAVPIPLTLKIDSVKVIRRDEPEEE